MNLPTIASTTTTTKAASLSSRLSCAAVALSLGLVIIFGVGFAQGSNGALHNAAHDTRHIMAFPCH